MKLYRAGPVCLLRAKSGCLGALLRVPRPSASSFTYAEHPGSLRLNGQAVAELGSDPNSGQCGRSSLRRFTDLAKPQVQGSDPNSAGHSHGASSGDF
jgi:hypothetical protein